MTPAADPSNQAPLVRFATFVLAVACAAAVSSCSTPQSTGEQAPASQTPRQVLHGECWWKGDGVNGSPKIHISLSEQCVRFYKGGEMVGISPISSGREGHSTPPGAYRIIEKDRHHRSSLYGAFCDAGGQIVVPDVDVRKDRAPPGTHFVGAEMPCFMRITGAAGMHEGFLPGYPASHGCIRMPGNMAEIFFRETPHGTPVLITGNAADAPRHDAAPVQPAPAAEVRSRSKTDEAPASLVSVKSRTKPQSGGGFFSRGKKPPPPARGVTLYLE